MSAIDVYDAKGVVFDERELDIPELPPIPDGFNEAVAEAGGNCNGFPNVKVVSGYDPAQVEWIGGKFWRKYAFRAHSVNEYSVWNKPDGSKQIITKKEAEILSKSKKLDGIIIPVVDRVVTEYPIPRYFVEIYRPPQFFGNEEAWDKVRFNEDEDGKLIDLMGEFPHEGRYETWFCIEEPVVINGEIVRTQFRSLDDSVLGLIILKIEEVKAKDAAQLHIEKREEIDKEFVENAEKLKEDIKEIVADRIDKLIQ